MQSLAEKTQDLKDQLKRYTAGRWLQSLAIAKGNVVGAIESVNATGKFSKHWNDRDLIVNAFKALISPIETGDFPAALVPIADSFLAAMRSYSVPGRLTNLIKVPMLTLIYVNAAAAIAAEVTEGSAIPVLAGDWTVATLLPRKFAAIVVQTNELLASTSPAATLAIVDDLAQATAEAENRAFCSPDEIDSVLFGANNFNASGSALANVDADLKRLIDLVPGAFRPGAAFIMTQGTATTLSLLRGSGSAAAYPDISPQGGYLLGLPVLVTSACELPGSPPTRIVGLLSPSEIFWADQGIVELSTSNKASLKMDNAPSSTAGNLVSLFQSNSTATKAVRESSWFARSGAAAYFISGY